MGIVYRFRRDSRSSMWDRTVGFGGIRVLLRGIELGFGEVCVFLRGIESGFGGTFVLLCRIALGIGGV